MMERELLYKAINTARDHLRELEEAGRLLLRRIDDIERLVDESVFAEVEPSRPAGEARQVGQANATEAPVVEVAADVANLGPPPPNPSPVDARRFVECGDPACPCVHGRPIHAAQS